MTGADVNDAVFKKMAERLSMVEKRLPSKTVAVYGFESLDGRNSEYAKYATEKHTHEIVQIGDLTVIERSRIDQVPGAVKTVYSDCPFSD